MPGENRNGGREVAFVSAVRLCARAGLVPVQGGRLLSEGCPCEEQGCEGCLRALMGWVELLGMHYSLQSNTEFWHCGTVAAFTQ